MIDLSMAVVGNISPEALAEYANLPEAQRVFTQAVIDYMNPYWAYDTGALVDSANTSSDLDTGKIVYSTPYAYQMYYGIRGNGVPINYKTEKHPLAGPYPLDRMVADHMEDIVEEVRAVVDGK